MAGFCGNCGKPLPDVGDFCGQCGTKVIPPQAEIFNAKVPQSSDGPGSSAVSPGPVPDAASALFNPPSVPPAATPPLWDSQQELATTGKSTTAARRSNFRVVVFVIAAIAIGVVIVAVNSSHIPNVAFDNHGSISIWKTYRYPADGFSAAFPSTPKVSSWQVGPLKQRTYVSVVSDTTMLFVFVSNADDFKGRDPDEMLKRAENAVLESTKTKLIRDNKITQGVYHGLEFESESQGTHLFGRWYIVGTSLYHIWAGYQSGSPYAETTRFLDSSKLIERVQQ
jgi:hypothetical protein